MELVGSSISVFLDHILVRAPPKKRIAYMIYSSPIDGISHSLVNLETCFYMVTTCRDNPHNLACWLAIEALVQPVHKKIN